MLRDERVPGVEIAPAVRLVAEADVPRALEVIRARAARERAATQPQTDLEQFTGTAPAQEAREAEAGGIAADRLRSIVSRIERLNEERKALADDIKDIYLEAKSSGFCPKALRALIALRRKDPADLEEAEALLEVYRKALGM